ncbi:general odorant-binding protein 66-like [Arctopsyche grandis]|uniref:general odorant-binding protein 66-like n=1 Tax=Arctopsyche grandis TaxID=121162 RepID=UPI00406D77E4
MRSLLLSTAAIYTVAFANIPEKCKKPAPKSPGVECCEDFDSFITPNIFNGCHEFQPENDDELPPCEAFVCILKNVGIIGADNKVDRTKVKNVLTQKYSGDWAAVGKNSAEKCFTEMERLKSPCEAQTFAICFLKNSIKNCPEKRWKNTKECNDSRNYVVECAEELM